MIWGIAMTSVQSGLRNHIEVCRFGHHRAGLLRSFWVSAYRPASAALPMPSALSWV